MEKLEELFPKFIEYIKTRGFSGRSVESYTLNLKYFYDFMVELGITNIAAVDRRVIHDFQTRVYLQTFRGRALSPATRQLRLTVLRTFFRYLLKAGEVLYDPTTGLELPKTSKQLPRKILNKKDIAALLSRPNLETPRGIRDRAILEVFYSTGIRSTELTNLTLNDLDLRAGELRINNGKGGKDRIVPLGEVACDYLALYLRKSRPKLAAPNQNLLFVNQSGAKFSRAYLYCMINRYAKKAGLPVLGPHALRHTCATHLLRGRADIRQIQELLGHASIGTTQRYTRVEISNLKQVLKRCHPREKGEIRIDDFPE